MKYSFKKRLAALGLALCALAWAVLPVSAAVSVVDTSRTGSVTVTLYDHQKDAPLRDGSLTLYKVADVELRYGSSMEYVYTGQFTDCDLELGDLSDGSLAARLEAWLPVNAEGTTCTLSQQGKAEFKDLPVGVYLVVQTKASRGYEAINPFVVSVPLLQDGEWVYAVDASPKVGGVTPDKTPEQPGSPGSPTPVETPDKPAKPSTVVPGITVENPAAPAVPGTETTGTPDETRETGTKTPGGLPQAGQLNWPVPFLACSGILLFAAGWTLNRKENGCETENW